MFSYLHYMQFNESSYQSIIFSQIDLKSSQLLIWKSEHLPSLVADEAVPTSTLLPHFLQHQYIQACTSDTYKCLVTCITRSLVTAVIKL